MVYKYVTLQKSTKWNISTPLFEYVNTTSYNAFWLMSSSDGRLYHAFPPRHNDKYLQSLKNHGIQLVEAEEGTDFNQPAFVLKIYFKLQEFKQP